MLKLSQSVAIVHTSNPFSIQFPPLFWKSAMTCLETYLCLWLIICWLTSDFLCPFQKLSCSNTSDENFPWCWKLQANERILPRATSSAAVSQMSTWAICLLQSILSISSNLQTASTVSTAVNVNRESQVENEWLRQIVKIKSIISHFFTFSQLTKYRIKRTEELILHTLAPLFPDGPGSPGGPGSP